MLEYIFETLKIFNKKLEGHNTIELTEKEEGLMIILRHFDQKLKSTFHHSAIISPKEMESEGYQEKFLDKFRQKTIKEIKRIKKGL